MTFAAKTLTVQVSPEAKSTVGSSVKVVGPPLGGRGVRTARAAGDRVPGAGDVDRLAEGDRDVRADRDLAAPFGRVGARDARRGVRVAVVERGRPCSAGPARRWRSRPRCCRCLCSRPLPQVGGRVRRSRRGAGAFEAVRGRPVADEVDDRRARRAGAGERGRRLDERDLAGGRRHGDRAARVRRRAAPPSARAGALLDEVVLTRLERDVGQARDLPRRACRRRVLNRPAVEADGNRVRG